MKKIFPSFLLVMLATAAFGQWSPVTLQSDKIQKSSQQSIYYSFEYTKMVAALSRAEESGKYATPVEVTLPTLDGRLERFAVYSSPVVVKSLADRYELGSYAGVGIDDPSAYVRFSIAPNDFQSMMVRNGVYEFIEPQNVEKSIYRVHPKSTKSEGDKAFVCSTNETPLTKQQLDQMYSAGKTFDKNALNFNKSSDKKFRTLRLALSVTGEYTKYFGGVSQALTAMNATLTRVNGIFERDFALRLILQDFPALIYTDPATDPYSSLKNWNVELQKTLTSTIGNNAYDIGHLFGAAGGGGNAGCVGCICINPSSDTDKAKGSGITSPANGIPKGDSFDLDFVAHELGHQVGATHTFSHLLEGQITSIEPGSGSTLMGYAGITGANTDVQSNSDPYFHVISINQVQSNLIAKTCDVEVPISNNPPFITAMPDVTIPKSTAFVLTAQATDSENNALTYTWEEIDNAMIPIDKTNLGNTTTGASFRSLPPVANPARSFPKLETVLSGVVRSPDSWESASTVARTTNFSVNVRDNHPDATQKQTQSSTQKVIVSDKGPFKITSSKVYNNASGPLTWDVVGTNASPFNVKDVKIDYTKDNGASWTLLTASTPNDGAELFSFASAATDSELKVRISAIGNVFYAVETVIVSPIAPCDGTAPKNFTVTDITMDTAKLSWDAVAGATYIVRYKKSTETTWTQISVSGVGYLLTGLMETTDYNVQVAAVCSGSTSAYANATFKTTGLTYCELVSNSATDEFISKVEITAEGAAGVTSVSGASTYTDYSDDATRLVKLKSNTTNNIIKVTKTWPGTPYDDAVSVWIDFNRNGIYEQNEMIMSTAPNQTTSVTATFSVPADAYTGDKTVGMRVALRYNGTQTSPCGTINYGEVEDYAVKISSVLGINNPKTDQIQVYPNPAIDLLNITKVTDKASYKIYNMAGQLVSNGKVIDYKVQVTNLLKGVYIISIEEDGEIAKLKFIKK
ncbi:reprolysin-like metallopeptidase [Kaistella polysaccharea]|uniref:reprolysin-like metallopeptidase n=1 Tax=Kaistella polysaccharea TaxID=2878534 RepID=UPI001CF5C0E8|nr:GEVED domain-containing protein [Kaistella polysaccharea]